MFATAASAGVVISPAALKLPPGVGANWIIEIVRSFNLISDAGRLTCALNYIGGGWI
jgi:hypothetical protein